MIILDFLQSKLKDYLFQGNVTYYNATSDQGPYPGGVLGYFHAYVDSGHFWGIKIFNFNIFGVFRKMNIFGGMIRFCGYILGVITKMDYI